MEHNPNLTAAYLMGAVDKHVKGQARRTVRLNAERDPNARYARIPDGEACEFCKALGSRGFIYHSEESASERASDGDTFHPYCNCQVAVSFDPFIEDYWVGPVHVTRGYGMEDAQLVRPGRDGSFELRDVDIDELFEQYKAAGRSFNKRSVYRDYAGMPKFMSDPLAYLRGAESVEQLEKRADEMLAAYKRHYDDKQLAKYLPSARAAAQGRMRELKAAESKVQSLRYEPPHLTAKLPEPDPVIKTDAQLGKKIGQHAGDWGLDPTKEADRLTMRDIIDGIINAPDEVVEGEWRSQPNPCLFFIKGDDVVVVNAENEFVSVLKDGAVRNKRVKHARDMG